MRRMLTIIVILCQVLVLGAMAGKREYVGLSGHTVYLRTAPVDPRDMFRGDYVRLRYEISTVPFEKVSPELRELFKTSREETTVYAALEVGEDGLAQVASLQATRPDGLFLKGSFPRTSEMGWTPGGLPVKYGIESYFVEQGKGLDMEKMRGSRNTVQVPMEVEVAVGGDGTAVLKNHRWSSLGMGIEALVTRQTGTVPRRKSAQFRITFLNNSPGRMALVSMPGYCSLVLEPVSASGERAPRGPERSFCSALKPTEQDVFLLEPQEKGYVEMDLSDADWNVLYEGKVQEPGELPWQERFRITYRPPDAAACSGLAEAKSIWHGRIATAAFHGRGNVD